MVVIIIFHEKVVIDELEVTKVWEVLINVKVEAKLIYVVVLLAKIIYIHLDLILKDLRIVEVVV